MRSVILDCVEDWDGKTGLVVQGLQMTEDDLFVAVEGRLVAHDLVEHCNGVHNIGSITDEMEALGGLWYTRGHLGDISRGDGPVFSGVVAVASEFVSLFDAFMADNKGVDLTVTVSHRCEADEAFYSILYQVKRDLDEVRRRWNYSGLKYDDEKEKRFLAAIVPRLRIGYRKCHRRFGDIMTANRVFWNIADAVHPHIAEAQVGNQFRLTWSHTKARCEPLFCLR